MPIVPGKAQLLHHRDAAGMTTKTGPATLLRGEHIDTARCCSELPNLVWRSLPVELVKIVHAIDLIPCQDLEVRRLGKRRGIERERQKYVGGKIESPVLADEINDGAPTRRLSGRFDFLAHYEETALAFRSHDERFDIGELSHVRAGLEHKPEERILQLAPVSVV